MTCRAEEPGLKEFLEDVDKNPKLKQWLEYPNKHQLDLPFQKIPKEDPLSEEIKELDRKFIEACQDE